jgi:Nucleotidyl transferase
MSAPTLVIMAAGMGSRYGGLKQIDPVGPSGEIIIDYSIYDALRAGFEKVVFIIRKDLEKSFRQTIGKKIESRVEVEYAFQELSDLPDGFSLPDSRQKPWGTGHAVLSTRQIIKDENFAVINADDFYGASSFETLCQYLKSAGDSGNVGDYCLVGYTLWKTLSDYGHVARGICQADDNGFLTGIDERVRIEKDGKAARFTEDQGQSWTGLDRESLVSMNMWGFTPGFLSALSERFPAWLTENGSQAKTEFFVPVTVGEMLKDKKARVKVLPTNENWFGVTYREDAPRVKAAVEALLEAGKYPKNLWGE